MIYLDSAATSFRKPASVEKSMVRALRTMSSPGRGAYTLAMRASDTVYECRELIGELFNFKYTERIAFTFNATHALNIAIASLARQGEKAVISGYEHNSVTRALMASGMDIAVAAAPLFDSKAVLDSFRENLKGAKLAVCNHVSNVFGFIQPVYEIAELCRENGIPLIVDASQSAGAVPLDAVKLGADFIAMPGHKGLMGPQGTGVLLCGAEPKPIIYGGTGSDSLSQTMPSYLPDMLEAGTHNIPGIAGLSEGVRYVLKHSTEKIGLQEQYMCRLMQKRLKNIEELELFSGDKSNQAGVLSLRQRDKGTEKLCEGIGKRGIAARCGLHCAPLAHKTAGTIDTGTLRLSYSPFISEREVNMAAEIIESEIVHKK